MGWPGKGRKPNVNSGSWKLFPNTALRVIIPGHISENSGVILVCRTPSQPNGDIEKGPLRSRVSLKKTSLVH